MDNGVREMYAKSKTPIVIDGREIVLTNKQRAEMRVKQLSLALVQQRINEGWTLKQALKYNSTYVTKNNEICWMIPMIEMSFYIPVREKERINVVGARITERVKKGEWIDEILGDIDYYVEYNGRTHYDLATDDIERKLEAEKLEEERKKRLKPWLYDGTPQAVKPSEWFKYLCENDLMKKAVR